MRIVVVVPTYNEKDNIEPLISSLQQEFKLLPEHDWHLLIVDGKSPDGTGEIIKQAITRFNNIYLLEEEEKAGIGAAYIQGFEYAMKELGAEVVWEMDADLSHDPKYLKPMVEALEQGADVALGSRYVPGGSIPSDWGLDRKVFSMAGNLVARAVLWVWPIRDFTSGFRATKVKGFLDQVDFNKLLSKQYAYKIHLLYALYELGAVIKEIPIRFVDRKKGYSKMPANNIIESLRVVITLRFRQLQQFIKVCVVGTLGFTIQTVIYTILLQKFGVPSFNATIIGAEAAVLAMFPVNNWWSFKDSAVVGSAYFKKLLQFNLVAFGSIAIQWVTLFAARYFFGPGFLADWVFYVLAVLLGLIWNFTMYKRVVWRV